MAKGGAGGGGRGRAGAGGQHGTSARRTQRTLVVSFTLEAYRVACPLSATPRV